MTLYKYVTSERIDVLQNELIRFTQPSALNDPWDVRPHVERLLTDHDLEQLAAPLMRQTDEELIDQISKIIENISKSHNLGNKSFDEIKQVVVEANREFPGELKQLYEGVFTQTVETARQALPQAIEFIPDALDKTMGVLSLTEKPNHPLMWSHYTGNHSGFVLAFDEGHEFFRSPRYGEPDDMGSLRRVKYSSERPRFDPLVDMSLVNNMSDEYAISWLVKMFFTKSQEWAYEQEWRMLKPLDKANKMIETPTGNVLLFSLPSGCVTGVILGERMTAETRRQVVELVKTDQRYKHVTLFEARASNKTFTIELRPLEVE